ncbi:hypothetical protein GCM10026982_01260 [Nocardiopsis aegyptia]
MAGMGGETGQGSDGDSQEKEATSPEDCAPEDDTGEAAESAKDLAPTRLPALAVLLAFLVPPAGAVLGHVTVRRTYWRRSLSRLAIAAGWTMTALSASGLLLYLNYQDRVARAEAVAAAEAQAEEQMRRAIADSPSYGLVDEEFCQALTEVAEISPRTEFVTSQEQISGAMLEGYETLAGTDTPNAQVYGDYAEYLTSFADHDVDGHVAQAEALQQAVNEDVLACLPFVDETLE